MMARHAMPGRVEALFVRPERRADPLSVREVQINLDGLAGDHARQGKRAVTLIQAEHLYVIAQLTGRSDVDPVLLRRNIVVLGINLLGLRKQSIRVGEARMFVHGPCPPCSRMEEALGIGGYSAMRGHGGVYAEVIELGPVVVGSQVARLADQETPSH